MVVLWAIWKEQCGRIFEEREQKAEDSVGGVELFDGVYFGWQVGDKGVGKQRNGQLAEEWRPPRGGVIKVNYDAAFWHSTTGTGHRRARAMERDHEAELLMLLSVAPRCSR